MKELEAPQKSMSGGEMHEDIGKSFPLLGETPSYLGGEGSQNYNPKKKSQPSTMKFLG